MFKVVDKKGSKYSVLDTSDGVVENISVKQILKVLKSGVPIEGVQKTSEGCHIDIDNSSHKIAKTFLTSKEVAKYMNCSVTVVNSLEKQGILKPARRLPTNNKRLYLLEDVDAYIDSIRTR